MHDDDGFANVPQASADGKERKTNFIETNKRNKLDDRRRHEPQPNRLRSDREFLELQTLWCDCLSRKVVEDNDDALDAFVVVDESNSYLRRAFSLRQSYLGNRSQSIDY